MQENNTPHKDIADKVVTHFGTHLALAKALGYEDLRNVSAWANGLRAFPEKHCVTIERETGKLITRQQLRPDDWQDIWPELVTPVTAPVVGGLPIDRTELAHAIKSGLIKDERQQARREADRKKGGAA